MANPDVRSMTRLASVEANGGGRLSWWLANITLAAGSQTMDWDEATVGVIATGPVLGTPILAVDAGMGVDNVGGLVAGSGRLNSDNLTKNSLAINALPSPSGTVGLQFIENEVGTTNGKLENQATDLQLVCVFQE